MALISNKGVGKNAPKLAFIGDKWNNKGTYRQGSNEKGYYFGQIPAPLRRYINHHLTGSNGNLLKLIYFLIESDEGFGISQAMILDQLGMDKAKYYKARQELIDMNWLCYKEDTHQPMLMIDYNFMWAQALLPDEEQAPVELWRKTRGQR